jgi:hypothetical protein
MITKASGTKRVVLARFARNRRLGDALFLQAFAALNNSPGPRAFYDRLRARGATHYQALRTRLDKLTQIGVKFELIARRSLTQQILIVGRSVFVVLYQPSDEADKKLEEDRLELVQQFRKMLGLDPLEPRTRVPKRWQASNG